MRAAPLCPTGASTTRRLPTPAVPKPAPRSPARATHRGRPLPPALRWRRRPYRRHRDVPARATLARSTSDKNVPRHHEWRQHEEDEQRPVGRRREGAARRQSARTIAGPSAARAPPVSVSSAARPLCTRCIGQQTSPTPDTEHRQRHDREAQAVLQQHAADPRQRHLEGPRRWPIRRTCQMAARRAGIARTIRSQAAWPSRSVRHPGPEAAN